GTVALGWAATRSSASVGGAQLDAAERAVIAGSFAGSRTAYLAALARHRANRGLARAALADQLRRGRVEAGLRVPPASGASLAAFYDANGTSRARLVTTKTPVDWLGGRTRGIALETLAPARVFTLPTGRDGLVQTPACAVAVRPLEATLPLAAIPLSLARPAVAAAVVHLEKADAYQA